MINCISCQTCYRKLHGVRTWECKKNISQKSDIYVRDQSTFIIFLGITDNYIPIL